MVYLQTSAKPLSTKGSLHQLLSGRSSSDGQPVKSNSLGRNVASFDAKFAAVPPGPVQSDVGVGVSGGRGQASSGSVSGVLSSGGSSGHGSSSDEADHTLTGSWELLWETRLQKSKMHLYLIKSIIYIYKDAFIMMLPLLLQKKLALLHIISCHPFLYYCCTRMLLNVILLIISSFCSCLCPRLLQSFQGRKAPDFRR